jgi:hypothetical protein
VLWMLVEREGGTEGEQDAGVGSVEHEVAATCATSGGQRKLGGATNRKDEDEYDRWALYVNGRS